MHRKFYQQEIALIKEDFAEIKEHFNKLADTYENIYVEGFQKEMEKFDQHIEKIKYTFKEYVQEKNQESSFFTSLFDRKKDDNDIESLVNKNAKAFDARAKIILLKQVLNTAKNNKLKYKGTEY